MSELWMMEEKKLDDPYDPSLSAKDGGDDEGLEALFDLNGVQLLEPDAPRDIGKSSPPSVLNITQDTVDTSTLPTNLSLTSFDESIPTASPPPSQKKKKGLFGSIRRNKNKPVAASSQHKESDENGDTSLFVHGANVNILNSTSSRPKSQNVERFIATVVEKENDDQPDCVFQKENDDASVRSIDEVTSKRLEDAMLDDDEESITSLEGIKKFRGDYPCQIIAPNKAMGAKVMRPKKRPDVPESQKKAHRRSASWEDAELPQPSIFRAPEFVPAPQGEHPAILMQNSWESLVSCEAVSPEDAPKIVLVSDDQPDGDTPPETPSRGGQKIQFIHSPRASTESARILKDSDGVSKKKGKTNKPWHVARFMSGNKDQKGTEKKVPEKAERRQRKKGAKQNKQEPESTRIDSRQKQEKKLRWRQNKTSEPARNETKEATTGKAGKPIKLFCYENGQNRSMQRVLSAKGPDEPERAISPTSNVQSPGENQ